MFLEPSLTRLSCSAVSMIGMVFSFQLLRKELASKLSSPPLIFASPFSRTIQTAQLIAEELQAKFGTSVLVNVSWWMS